MNLDIRPVSSARLGDIAMSIRSGANPRVDELVAQSADVLGTAHRLGVRALGTHEKPLFVHLTADPVVSSTPYYLGHDTFLLGTRPIDGHSREFLRSRSTDGIPDGATWLDIDLGTVVPHEIGHGVVAELVPQVMQPIARTGAWRTREFERAVVTEGLADAFAAIHERAWDMTLAGVAVRDAARGVDHLATGYATVDALNEARTYARTHGIDHVNLTGANPVTLEESRPHRLAGLLTPAFAAVQHHHGWHATEAVFSSALGAMRASGDTVDVPLASKSIARAAAAQLGRQDDAALAVRRMLIGNGSTG